MTSTLTTQAPAFPSVRQVGQRHVPKFTPDQGSSIESESLFASRTGATAKVVRVIGGCHWLSGRDIIRPIRVEIHGATSGITVSERQTGIFGVGSDPASAINDFRAALKEHLEVLESSESLSEELKHQLSILRRHLRTS
jgi:hypothetical protein